MKVKEILKDYKLKGYRIIFKDLYGNEYIKEDLTPQTVFKIEDLETRNVNINFRIKNAVFYLYELYELMKEKEI